jgi:hypothetical protein
LNNNSYIAKNMQREKIADADHIRGRSRNDGQHTKNAERRLQMQMP